jgi:hypothetical protein
MAESRDANAARLRRLRADNPQWSTAKNAKWNAANREKRLAHRRVEAALLAGRLVRCACERCGAVERVQAHHDDYSKPLAVRWLCAVHHRERHRELASEAGSGAGEASLKLAPRRRQKCPSARCLLAWVTG